MFNLANLFEVLYVIILLIPVIQINDHKLSFILMLISLGFIFLTPKNFIRKHIYVWQSCAAILQIISLFFIDVYNPWQFFILADAVIYNTMLLLCAFFNDPHKKYYGVTLAQIIGAAGMLSFLLTVFPVTKQPPSTPPDLGYYIIFVSFTSPGLILRAFGASSYIINAGIISVSISSGLGLVFNKPFANYYSRGLIKALSTN